MLKKLSYFQNTAHKSSPVNIIFCIRNEMFRLQFFLDYYRRLGVTSFYAVDNGSTDGGKEYLLEQDDVALFYTDKSYKSCNAGRDWTSYLASEYCDGQWCLTLDVDEFFVMPFIEYTDLKTTVSYLDANNYEGVAALFLDFYSEKNLSETNYTPGASPFDVCQYFDNASSYKCYETETFPFLEIKGGPRQRYFWANEGDKSGPSMRKVPLVKWKSSFEYLVAAHSCTPIRLADVTSVLAHFKFLSHFKEFAASEVKRNERVANSSDWKLYAKTLKDNDANFYSQGLSIEYQNSSTLLDAGHLAASKNYLFWIRETLVDKKLDESKRVNQIIDSAVKQDSQKSITFSDLSKIWTSVSYLSHNVIDDTKGQQSLLRIERQMDRAVNSRLWRYTYRLRKFFSKYGLTDQRSVTEENYLNQSLDSRFTFVYNSIWWDLLGPFRAIEKILMRIGLLRRPN